MLFFVFCFILLFYLKRRNGISQCTKRSYFPPPPLPLSPSFFFGGEGGAGGDFLSRIFVPLRSLSFFLFSRRCCFLVCFFFFFFPLWMLCARCMYSCSVQDFASSFLADDKQVLSLLFLLCVYVCVCMYFIGTFQVIQLLSMSKFFLRLFQSLISVVLSRCSSSSFFFFSSPLVMARQAVRVLLVLLKM